MRSAQEVTDIWVTLLPRFVGSSATLQGRIKEMLVHSILTGLLPADSAVPPSRSLASTLGVSRNTVALALQLLVDKGFLVARERSGLYVNRDILLSQASASPEPSGAAAALDWVGRLKTEVARQRNIAKPLNWADYPYPFVYGQFDHSLMPLADWRDCSHQSLLAPAVKKWSKDFIDADYGDLLDQILRRLLPARGIVAQRDEVLVTAGAQMACYLLATVLLDRHTVVGIEDPGYPDARNNFRLRSDRVKSLPIDAQGLVASRAMGRCAYVYVTPSHQCPTGVTMPLARRQQILDLARRRDVILFEDDHESELNFTGRPLPALKSLDTDGRVIYLGSLSKTLAHGLRIGFVVGPAPLIRELKALRRLILRHVPSNNAHIASLFIAQGHHDAFIRKLNVVYRERREVLLAAMARWLPQYRVSMSLGGSGAWVRAPAQMDCRDLARECATQGVLIEPGQIFFNRPGPTNQCYFRLGYSAIPVANIEPGIRALAAASRALQQ